MSNVAWEIAHSVEANVTASFAWKYMTDVANWDDPPATFELLGPFMIGSSGVTRLPDQESLHWQIREVSPMTAYTIEMALDRATISFDWRFGVLTGGRTRLTQHIALRGENAAAYLAQVQAAYALSLAAGMSKIAMAMELAEAITGHSGS